MSRLPMSLLPMSLMPVSRLPELPVSLRPLCDGDMPALASMWVESWREVFPDIDFAARRDWFVQRMVAHRAGGVHITLALAQDTLQGFVTVDPARGFIDQLAVAKAALGRGVAQALLAQARGLSPAHLALDVNEANSRALRFYMRQGFAVTGNGVNASSGLRLLRLEWRGA